MESLQIRNFLTIRDAHIDVGRFNLFIGPQASGKSVAVKLLYFFRDFLAASFLRSIEALENKRQLQQAATAKFEQIFPKYAWVDQDFSLVYRIGEVEVTIEKARRTSKRSTIKLDFSPNLSQVQYKAKHRFRKNLEDSAVEPDRRGVRYQYDVLFDVLRQCIYDAPIGESFRRSVFVPATRSFFAALQKNVFTFLANNIDIDPLIKEFGSTYESSKLTYDRRHMLRRPENTGLIDKIKADMEHILSGRYVYEEDQDWIVSSKRRTNIANASSGQQEALPMLLVLAAWGARRTSRPVTFFIEEPEAHLFPISQRRIVNLFSRLYNATGHDFVLTTHSPYILTALNNLLLASNIAATGGESVRKKVSDVIGGDLGVLFEDVRAYTVENGNIQSIIDPETRLIGASVIDSVSDEFDQVFDDLVELELSLTA